MTPPNLSALIFASGILFSDLAEKTNVQISDVNWDEVTDILGNLAAQIQSKDIMIGRGPILVHGNSGSGKSTIAKYLGDRAYDIDLFGMHVKSAPDVPKDDLWIVRFHTLAQVVTHNQNMVYLGSCKNIEKEITWCTNCTSHETTVRRELPIKQSIPWGLVIRLWYRPTDEQRALRFGPTRDNRSGKDDAGWERVKRHLLEPYSISDITLDVSDHTPLSIAVVLAILSFAMNND